jgi:hypothetical protein
MRKGWSLRQNTFRTWKQWRATSFNLKWMIWKMNYEKLHFINNAVTLTNLLNNKLHETEYFLRNRQSRICQQLSHHHCPHKNPPRDPVVSQANPIYILILFFCLCLELWSGLFTSAFRTEICYPFPIISYVQHGTFVPFFLVESRTQSDT